MGSLLLFFFLASKLVIDELNHCFEAEWELRRLRSRPFFHLLPLRVEGRRRLERGFEETGQRLLRSGHDGLPGFLILWFVWRLNLIDDELRRFLEDLRYL